MDEPFEPPLIGVAVQPVGVVSPVAGSGRKSLPGTQASQKLPIVVVPVSFRVMLYWNVVGLISTTLSVAAAVSLMARTPGGMPAVGSNRMTWTISPLALALVVGWLSRLRSSAV